MSRLPQACMALAVVLACLGGGVREAAACSCVLPDNMDKMTQQEIDSWRFERASNVVRGRVLEFYADGKTVRGGMHVAIARMKVSSIVKGTVSVGDLTLVTPSFGGASCSMSGALLSAVASEHDVILSVGDAPSVKEQQEHWIFSCGYFVDAPRERASQLRR